jgi:hypothetical protein
MRLILVRRFTVQSTLANLLAAKRITFKRLEPSLVPQKSGVYAIEYIHDNHESWVLYVGQSKNLRDRIYCGHLVGVRPNARLKRKLVADGVCPDLSDARDFLEHCCRVRWVTTSLPLLRLETFVARALKPLYGRDSPNA